MNWSIQAVGKPALDYAKRGIAEYQKRVRRYAKVEIDYTGKDLGKEANAARHLERSSGSLRIALDERGEQWSTGDLVKKVNAWEQRGVKRVALMIGGADGHPQELRDQADEVWALSPLTLQHELALLVLMEQIYRCYTIKQGTPYHR